MSGNKSLKVSARPAIARLTADQERFQFLIAQIEKVRAARVVWEASVVKFRQAQVEKMSPLRQTLSTTCRETVFTIDRLLDQPGWSRMERGALQDILRGTAEILLEANEDDVELKAAFDKHSAESFDAAKQEELQRLKEKAEEFTGLNLGDDAGIRTEEDLIQRMYEEMAAREAADAAGRSDKSQRHRQSAEQKRVEASAQLAKESLRQLYRKLASAVHPDRESDPHRREAKTALMQKINQAYAANDLLALFETQMQIEQIDAEHIGKMSEQRLKQYNKLLAQQLENARAAIRTLESDFRTDHGLEPGSGLDPQKLSQLIVRQARGIRAEIDRQKQFLLVLAQKTSTKRWLKEQRRFARDLDFVDDE